MVIVLRASTHTAQSPTPDFNLARTAAVATYAADLTRTAGAPPSSAPTLPPSSTPVRLRATLSSASATATPSCYHLRWIRDVTVPDFSPMKPGEAFTKTWRVLNSGSCAWQPGFQFAFYGGDAMGGSNLVLTQELNPGKQTDLSVGMIAPGGTGIVIGTWRMSDATGWFFGDALTVKIDLGGETPTP